VAEWTFRSKELRQQCMQGVICIFGGGVEDQ